ncbi:hypothetical protein [Bacillus bombysepticus]|uniref:hypothetical protein n=1 Tax=Bacillus bombysepticus TaxID=658666 RepID=UPI00301595E4
MLEPFYEALQQKLNGKQMEIGDEYVYTCRNATIVFSMELDNNKEKVFSVKVISGEAKHIDVEVPLFENAG